MALITSGCAQPPGAHHRLDGLGGLAADAPRPAPGSLAGPLPPLSPAAERAEDEAFLLAEAAAAAGPPSARPARPLRLEQVRTALISPPLLCVCFHCRDAAFPLCVLSLPKHCHSFACVYRRTSAQNGTPFAGSAAAGGWRQGLRGGGGGGCGRRRGRRRIRRGRRRGGGRQAEGGCVWRTDVPGAARGPGRPCRDGRAAGPGCRHCEDWQVRRGGPPPRTAPALLLHLLLRGGPAPPLPCSPCSKHRLCSHMMASITSQVRRGGPAPLLPGHR